MKLAAQIAHSVGKLGGIGDESPIRCTARRPTIIQNDVLIAEVPQATLFDGTGRREDQTLTEAATKCIPVICRNQSTSARLILEAYREIDWSRCKRTPSHLRSHGKAILQRRRNTDEGYQSPEDN